MERLQRKMSKDSQMFEEASVLNLNMMHVASNPSMSLMSPSSNWSKEWKAVKVSDWNSPIKGNPFLPFHVITMQRLRGRLKLFAKTVLDEVGEVFYRKCLRMARVIKRNELNDAASKGIYGVEARRHHLVPSTRVIEAFAEEDRIKKAAKILQRIQIKSRKASATAKVCRQCKFQMRKVLENYLQLATWMSTKEVVPGDFMRGMLEKPFSILCKTYFEALSWVQMEQVIDSLQMAVCKFMHCLNVHLRKAMQSRRLAAKCFC